MTRTITINTLRYEASHGHKPRQPRHYATTLVTWTYTLLYVLRHL